MSKFSFLVELQTIIDQLNEAISIDALEKSSFFKIIKDKEQKIAKALELQWGYPEFLMYVKKITDGVKAGVSEWKHIGHDILSALGKLAELHTSLFPASTASAKNSNDAYKWDDHSHYDVNQRHRAHR
jgi:hypothetical protein